MKTILYATDYSQNSVAALRLAHLLAKKFNSSLIVLHVFDIPLTLSTVSMTHLKKEKRLFKENHARLKKFCHKHLGDIWVDMNITFVAEENVSVVDGILKKTTTFDADLIILGTKGTSMVKEIFMGSTTTGLIKKAPCAVFAVPAMSRLENFNTIVYATDFEQADIFAINKLVEIAKKFNASIKVVHISTTRQYSGDEQLQWFKEMLKQKVVYKKMEFDLIFADDIFEELNRYLEKSKANFLAMLERKDNSFAQKYLQKDLVKQMVKGTAIPLLSYNIGGL